MVVVAAWGDGVAARVALRQLGVERSFFAVKPVARCMEGSSAPDGWLALKRAEDQIDRSPTANLCNRRCRAMDCSRPTGLKV